MQPGDLRVLRGVFHGFPEEARTRGFPSPSLGGFGFVGYDNNLCRSDRIASILACTLLLHNAAQATSARETGRSNDRFQATINGWYNDRFQATINGWY